MYPNQISTLSGWPLSVAEPSPEEKLEILKNALELQGMRISNLELRIGELERIISKQAKA